MYVDPRIYLLVIANSFFFLLTMLVNARLAPFSLHLIMLGPMLILPALYFKYPSLILCSFLSGLVVDALLPQNIWLFTYGFPVISLFIRFIRSHFRAEPSYRFVSLAHIANGLCILLLSVTQVIHFQKLSAVGLQVLVIILLSHIVLTVTAPWFFNLERSLLRLFNIEHSGQDEFSVL